MIAGLLRILGGLAGIAALLLFLMGAVFAIGWLIGLVLRFVPLVGRRHRRGLREGRQPISGRQEEPSETFDQKVARVLAEEIEIVPYDPSWPQQFLEEKKRLIELPTHNLIRRIEHFGSTAVPGLAAKPIVDMLVEVTSLESAKMDVAPMLEARGYDYFWRPTTGEDVPPFYAWFIRRDPTTRKRTHHIHMVERDFPHWDGLVFRDYLIDHPDDARAYLDLKLQLASKFRNDREGYTSGKSDFVARIIAEAKGA